jgi:UDP-3-O-[3-hydroxymyristoyl] glucosamine N-acyltransferase
MGDGVMMGGCVGVKDHLTIGAGARIGGGSGLIRDVPAGASVLGYPGMDSRQCLRSWSAIAKLGDPPPRPEPGTDTAT